MRKIICLSLSILMILSLFCSCLKINIKTSDEKKAEAFEAAVKKGDQEAINNYVEKYFEWSDLLTAINVQAGSDLKHVVYDLKEEESDSLSPKKYIEYLASHGGIVAKITALDEFTQTTKTFIKVTPNGAESTIEVPVIAQKCKIEEIYHDYNENKTLNPGDTITFSTSWIGIHEHGYALRCIEKIPDITFPNRQYILTLEPSDDFSDQNIYSASSYALDLEEEYEFIKPYCDNAIVNVMAADIKLYSPSILLRREKIFEMCGISDQYPLPENYPYKLLEKSESSEYGILSSRVSATISEIIDAFGGTEGTLIVLHNQSTVYYYWEMPFGRYAFIRVCHIKKDDDPVAITSKLSSEYAAEYPDQTYSLLFYNRRAFDS